MIFLDSTTYSLAKDFLQFIIAGVGIWIAWRGLSTWREQIEGGIKHETSRRLHRSVLKLRDAIGHVRNPAIWPEESMKAEVKYPQADKSTVSAVYYLRWEKVIEALSELEVEQLEAEVLWGKDVVVRLKPIRSCVAKLNLSLRNFLSPYNERRNPDKDLDDVIYEFRSENEIDKFSQEIDEAVEDVERYLMQKRRV